jgi:hypothetical protein
MGAETHSKYLSLHEEEMVIIINPTYNLLSIIQGSQCLSLSEGDSGLVSTEGESSEKKLSSLSQQEM